MQAQGSLLQGSMMSNFINIYQTEGTKGLWRVSAAGMCMCVMYVFAVETVFKMAPTFYRVFDFYWNGSLQKKGTIQQEK